MPAVSRPRLARTTLDDIKRISMKQAGVDAEAEAPARDA